MYLNKEKRGGYYITSQDNFGENVQRNQILIKNLTETERRSRSLLNRNAEGKYKFSHKSIMEYFLARRIVEDKNFAEDFIFQGNDTAQLFYKEMLLNEILSPVSKKYVSIINKKFDQNKKIQKDRDRKFSNLTILRKSIFFKYRYSMITNKIYNNRIRFRSGIENFDFLYKIYLFNKIANDLTSVLKKHSIKDCNLMYKLNERNLKNLSKSLKQLEGYFLNTKLSQITIDDKDYLNDGTKISIETSISRYFNTINIVFDFYNHLFQLNSRSKLFRINQRKLFVLANNLTNELDKSKIQHLMGLSLDIYSRLNSDFILRRSQSFFSMYLSIINDLILFRKFRIRPF
jgi:hypothetical protein